MFEVDAMHRAIQISCRAVLIAILDVQKWRESAGKLILTLNFKVKILFLLFSSFALYPTHHGGTTFPEVPNSSLEEKRQKCLTRSFNSALSPNSDFKLLDF